MKLVNDDNVAQTVSCIGPDTFSSDSKTIATAHINGNPRVTPQKPERGNHTLKSWSKYMRCCSDE